MPTADDDGRRIVAGYDCTPGTYPPFSLVHAMVCEAHDGWPAGHFLLPMAVYIFTQNLWLALLLPGLTEVAEALFIAVARDWFGSTRVTEAESAAGMLIFDWLMQGMWGVLVGTLLVRWLGIPRLIPLYGRVRVGDQRATPAPAPKGRVALVGAGAGAREGAGAEEEALPPVAFDPDEWTGVPRYCADVAARAACCCCWLRFRPRRAPPPVSCATLAARGGFWERSAMLGLWALAYLVMFLERVARGLGMSLTWLAHCGLLAWVLATSGEFARLRARAADEGRPPPPPGVTLRARVASKTTVAAAWLAVEALVSIPAAAAPYDELYYWMWAAQVAVTVTLVALVARGPN